MFVYKMDLMCRLCCSTKFVNNDIFGEENALYLKMSLYLPIKVFKNDGLPNKICDRCSCKVNDLYQFCNETIEVQNRLRSILVSNKVLTDTVDLTRVKENTSPPPDTAKLERSTQTDEKIHNNIQPVTVLAPHSASDNNVVIKQEPVTASEIKEEQSMGDFDGGFSDDDDNVCLNTFKEQKKEKPVNRAEKRSKKKKGKFKDWLINVLPKETNIKVLENGEVGEGDAGVGKNFNLPIDVSKIKEDIEEPLFTCCICLTQCYTRREMLQHYKSHAASGATSGAASGAASGAGAGAGPAVPAPPPREPCRCARCGKAVPRADWAEHWARHWARDLRPYVCALCGKTFRDPYQILKHGARVHGAGAGERTGEAVPPPPPPRFVCDACPARFAFMRCLRAHRAGAHPELAARPLELRCGTCGRTFAHLNSLRRHLRSHSGERNFLCNVCGKALSSREHLKFHIRIHTGDKPNVCGVCGKGFVKKCNLTLHERVHSGEKPHVCSHCGKAFSQRSTLVIHERYHSGARPYVCSLCGRGFVAKGLLSMHLKSTCV